MTKNEFMAKLTDELKKRNIEDAADVAEEYEQHFVFKLADGYSEEEIAAKLGDPTALPLAPQLPAALRRRLRTVTLAALAVFAVCFVLAYIACSLCAGSLEFWHVWGWFGSRLIRPALDVLGSHGAPVYLETHKAVNTRIYAHLGFYTVDTCAIPGTGITQYAMLRPARRPLR